MPVPALGKRQRKWAPKTRTGCKTCKVRRKKCDEKKPSCARCLKDKFPCDGYEPSKVWVFEPSEENWIESSTPNVWSLPSRSPSTDNTDETTCHRKQTKGDESEELVDPEITGSMELVLRDPRFSDFLLEPTSAFTVTLDQNYTQYFLLKTAPLLSSTKRWQNFWQRIVPQAAWANDSVRHAMIAVSLTFDNFVAGTNNKAIIQSHRRRAITAFASEPSSSWEVGLIICRLFSSMAQCNEDFDSAMAHMKSGEKMLLEASRNPHHRTSEVVRLMAATFMGLFADSTIDFDVIKRFPGRERQIFRVLQKMCSEYAMMLRRITAEHWAKTIETHSMGFLSVVFTTLNQAISSAMYPDVLVFAADEGIRPAQEVRANLLEKGDLLSFEALTASYHTLFDDIEILFDGTPPLVDTAHIMTESGLAEYSCQPEKIALPLVLQQRIRLFVDNYVVQAAELEPRMTAGTFWLPESYIPGCLLDGFCDQAQQVGMTNVQACLHRPWRDRGHGDDVMKERREFYHEFVCQYRSGFMI